MNTTIFVPKTINVGYQNRSGTYTGKLAYVVYTDNKGKLRKEASWNSWRDHNIEPNTFDNVPTSGFVLNKKVGDYVSDWNHRHAYCRVYDPRDFEFEITIENLLYILENANSIKGKGLEGEFVYGWDGKDLILIPVESPDYKQIAEYNRIIHSNESIKAKDLVVGATYLSKDNTEYVYMGKFDYYSYGYRWLEDGEYKTSKNYSDVPEESAKQDRFSRSSSYRKKIAYDHIDYSYGKYFWFAHKYYDYSYVDGVRVNKSTYIWAFDQFKSISANKFITCVNNECTPNYSEIYQAMIKQNNFSPRDIDNPKYIPYSFDEFKKCAEELRTGWNNRQYNVHTHFLSDNYYIYELTRDDETNLWTVEPSNSELSIEQDFHRRFDFETVREEKKNIWGQPIITDKRVTTPMSIETLFEKLKPCYEEIYLQNGELYERKFYYGNKE